MIKVIKTKGLEIKPYEDADENAMIELLTNEKIKENFMIPDFRYYYAVFRDGDKIWI